VCLGARFRQHLCILLLLYIMHTHSIWICVYTYQDCIWSRDRNIGWLYTNRCDQLWPTIIYYCYYYYYYYLSSITNIYEHYVYIMYYRYSWYDIVRGTYLRIIFLKKLHIIDCNVNKVTYEWFIQLIFWRRFI